MPLGIKAGSVVKRAIPDKNVRLITNVQGANKDRVEQAGRHELGSTIRHGIVVIEKNITLADGTIISPSIRRRAAIASLYQAFDCLILVIIDDSRCVNVVGNGRFPFGVKRSQEVTPSSPVHLGDPELGLLSEAHTTMF
jgi:hypothetical protein